MKKRTFIQLSIITFFFSVIGAEFIPLFWLVAAVLSSLIITLVHWKKKQTKIALCLIGFFVGGIIRFVITIPAENNHIANWAKEQDLELEIEGRIVSDPQVEQNQQSFIIETFFIHYKEERIAVKGKIAINTQRYPLYSYGQSIRVKGKLTKPISEGSFSYEKYLAKEDVWGVMNRVTITSNKNSSIRDGPVEYFWKNIFTFKHYFQEKIEVLFPAPDASIVLGLLLGLRASIPDYILNDFQRTGLTHILAISGYNTTLLINIANMCCGNMERKKRTMLIIVIITFFSIITGLSASVIRAALMGILVVIALAFGRKAQGIHLLLLSAFLMVLQNPRILVWDVSFQLSFLSTLGILVLLPLCEKWFKKLPSLLQDNLPVTLSATVFTSPIILYYFGSFSFISLLTNILFLPLIPLAMISSFGALVFSFISMQLAQLIAGINWVLIRLLVDGVHICAALPFAAIKIPPIPLWGVGLIYSLIGIFIINKAKNSEQKV